MNLIISAILTLLLSGCAISSVPHNSDADIEKKDKQYFEYNECTYLFGPFNISDDLIVDDIIKNTIVEANKVGLYGDKLVNIEVKEGGYTVILFSKLCLYISGNMIYSDSFDN